MENNNLVDPGSASNGPEKNNVFSRAPSHHNKVAFFLAGILVFSITGLAIFLGVQNKNYSVNQFKQTNRHTTDEKPQKTPALSPEETILPTNSLFVLEKDPIIVSYSKDEDTKSTLKIAYNRTLISMPPVRIIAAAYPIFAEATYLYHGDVIGKEISLKNNLFERVDRWHVVSAVRKVKSTGLTEKELPRSEYEKNLSAYSAMLSGLLSSDLQKFILLDYRNEGENPLPSTDPNITSLELHEGYPYFNYYGDAATNSWKSSYLNLRRGTGQTGGGRVDIQSDKKNYYFIDYIPLPFETTYEQQPEVDTIYGTPIYKAFDQKNVLKAYDGHQYTKYIMRAENGFTYVLYK